MLTPRNRSGVRGIPLALLTATLLLLATAPNGAGHSAVADSADGNVFHTSIGTLELDPVRPRADGRPQRPVTWLRPDRTGIAGLLDLMGLLDSRLTAEQDTFVAEGREDDNFGRDRILYVGGPEDYGKSYTYLWWDMFEIDRDQEVTEADIELYLREAGPSGDRERTITAYPVELGRFSGVPDCRDSWDERDLTWDDRPDRSGEVLDREDVGTERDRYSLDITDTVIEWRRPEWNRDNRCNGGVVVHGDDRDGSYRGFDSSEGSNEPELDVEHRRDEDPPRGGMDPLPQYTTRPMAEDPTAASIDLGWWGEDEDPGTGIDYFELYGRANYGEWQKLAGEARTYGANFIGYNGTVYEFAIYPVDPAGNVKPPAESDSATHVDFDPPVSTIDPLPEYSPGPFELRWTGVDLPNDAGRIGSGIDYYVVHYNIGGGSWGLLADRVTENHIRFDRAQQGLSYQFRVMAVDRAGHREAEGAFEAQTFIDGLPPVVRIPAVNSIDNPRFIVQWAGEDPGGSGIVNYDLQMRQDGGAWTDWAMATTATSRAFEGEYGHVYSFRARARDRAGNLGAWPDRPQLVTAVIHRDDLTEILHLPTLFKSH